MNDPSSSGWATLGASPLSFSINAFRSGKISNLRCRSYDPSSMSCSARSVEKERGSNQLSYRSLTRYIRTPPLTMNRVCTVGAPRTLSTPSTSSTARPTPRKPYFTSNSRRSALRNGRRERTAASGTASSVGRDATCVAGPLAIRLLVSAEWDAGGAVRGSEWAAATELAGAPVVALVVAGGGGGTGTDGFAARGREALAGADGFDRIAGGSAPGGVVPMAAFAVSGDFLVPSAQEIPLS